MLITLCCPWEVMAENLNLDVFSEDPLINTL